MYHYIPSYIILYHCISIYISLYIIIYIIIYHYIALYIIIYHYISLYIIIYHCIIYHHISLYVNIYHYISSYITIYLYIYHYIILIGTNNHFPYGLPFFMKHLKSLKQGRAPLHHLKPLRCSDGPVKIPRNGTFNVCEMLRVFKCVTSSQKSEMGLHSLRQSLAQYLTPMKPA